MSIFTDFIEDPLVVVEAIYRKLDTPLESEEKADLQQWMAKHPQGQVRRPSVLRC